VKKTSAFQLMLSVAACTLAFGASAQTLTCGTDFAQIGDTKSTIQQKCGEPAAKDTFCKPPPAPGSPEQVAAAQNRVIRTNQCEPVEEWTYRPGRGQFVTMLRFENGTLQSMKYGDRMR
jgi:uncharacterized protein DUF2845